MANSKTALTLVGDGLTSLVNDALSEKIWAARVALRTDTEERVQVAQKAVKTAKNEKELFRARIELFEAEGALAVLPPLEKETPEQEAKPAPNIQAPVRDETAVPKTDTIKPTLQWLKTKQYAKRYTEEVQPISTNNGSITFTQQKSEWRIARTVAFIYRELVSAAKTREILLEENEVSGFMVNYLRDKNGKEITKNATDKAAKPRQKQPKSA